MTKKGEIERRGKKYMPLKNEESNRLRKKRKQVTQMNSLFF
jgi:hypothetical protein